MIPYCFREAKLMQPMGASVEHDEKSIQWYSSRIPTRSGGSHFTYFSMFCICTLSYIINKQWCIYIYTCILCISISYHRLYTHHICVLLLWSRMLIYCISQGRSTWSSPFLWSQSTCGIAANLHLLLFHLLSKCIYLVTFHVRRWADKKYSSWDLAVSVYPRL